MRQINLFIILMIGIMLTACQPSTPPPTSVTSNDAVGGISLSFPGDWTVFAEKSPIEGRQNVTLVRFPDGQEQLNIDQFPVIRVSYDTRAATSLAVGSSLEVVAQRQAERLAPRAIFGEPTVTQVDIYPAVLLKGENSGADRQYYFVFVDFAAEGGLVTVVLTAPDDVSAYETVARSIATTIRLTIKPDLIVPTPTIAPEETAFIFPEQTGLFGPPESTDEAAPESTAEIAPESTEDTKATEEPVTTEEPAATSEVAATEEVNTTEEAIDTTEVAVATRENIATEEAGTAEPGATDEVSVPTPEVVDTAARTITLNNGFTLVTLDGWKSSTNQQTTVGLTLGAEIEAAMLAGEMVPPEQGFILVELGKADEMFTGGAPDVDLQGRLEAQITATADYVPPLTYGEISELTINDQPAASVLATTENYDQYTLLIELGSGIFARLRMTTAPGEGETFIPQVLEVAESLSPAQQ